MSEGADGKVGFVRAMTLTDATMLVAGSMVGTGIFIVSADMSRILGSPGWLLTAWILTGVITVLGALAYGELAAMYPQAGGSYIFIREAMGPLMGFLYGWTIFLVVQTGTIAALGVGFGKFLGVMLPAVTADRFGWFPQVNVTTPGGLIELGLSPQRLVALVVIWVLTWVNLRGVKEGKTVQTFLTFLKTAVLAILILLAVTIGRNSEAVAANFGANFWAGTPAWSSMFVVTFGTVLVGSLFSSSGWEAPTYTAAEVQDPQRNLPRALLYGTGLVCLLYVLANVGYLSVLPIHGSAEGATVMARGLDHATQDRVATAVMETIFGASGSLIMAAAILVSTFGCANGFILSGARVIYAMASDGVFFERAGTLSSRGVPAFALVIQSIWASLLCLTGTYNQLLDYVVFAALLFYAITISGLFILRKKKPDVLRPYRAWGYPFLPALYIALASIIAILLLLADKTRAQAISGLVLVLLGIPVFMFWRRGAGKSA